MSKILKEARAYRRALLEAVPSLDDKSASTAAALFPRLKEDGGLVGAGTRVYWKGSLMRAAVDLWDTAANNPDNAPTLWEAVNYRDGERIIPEVITAGLAFAKGERGWWRDKIYISIIDNNVWTPDAYPSGWELTEEN